MARKSAVISPVKRKSRKIVAPTDYSIQFDDYLIHCEERNLTQGSIEGYRFYLGYLKKYLEENEHSLLVDEITERDIKDFLNFMRKTKNNTQATINSAIASIRPFFNYLIEQEIIQDHPMAKIKKGKIDQKPIIPFSNEDIKNLLKQPDKSRHAGYRDYCMMLMLLSTGMRISECLNLTISDIDFKNNRILIRESKNRTPRIVGMAKKIKPELQRFIRLCLPNAKPFDILFQNQDGGKLADNTIQENFREYGVQANIDPRIRVSPHTYRHTYAINYLKNGGSTASLREQLGHRTIETVEKYLYWSTDDKLEEFEKYNPLDKMELQGGVC
ncbi:site-specific recombinase XerD [Desulfosporosinus acidiphilus SJ4]|uniref:Site-specific recombinase XerD n=1 Tax=Desulfosporosinus acidiphilus (strain DSM 22704 / JCM 16185 / SJ4) TaxID=646529 RepID=I4D5D6_DESAJ|nr:tyrosine-type recombinase/integrase [Desulfosporosinus acidiphilus]AFM41010.1 site-specific recombinase XerD [Desulfosporosinus acidiphilus SJ4]